MTAFKLGTATVFAVAICSVQALAQVHFQNNLMPQPAEISFGSDALALNSTFAVEVPGVSDARLTEAIGRDLRRIEMVTGLRHAGRGVAGTTPLFVKVEHVSSPVQTLAEDESYSLHVSPFRRGNRRPD